MPEADDLRAVRAFFDLTQPELAGWLGLHRMQVAYAEAGRRALPLRAAVRLTALNLCVARAEGAAPAPIPTYLAPLRRRLAEGRYEAVRLAHALAEMRRRVAPLANWLAALPSLRATLAAGPEAALAGRWLTRLFDGEATDELAAEVGLLPQLLLAARLAAVEHEIALLEQGLAEWQP